MLCLYDTDSYHFFVLFKQPFQWGVAQVVHGLGGHTYLHTATGDATAPLLSCWWQRRAEQQVCLSGLLISDAHRPGRQAGKGGKERGHAGGGGPGAVVTWLHGEWEPCSFFLPLPLACGQKVLLRRG